MNGWETDMRRRVLDDYDQRYRRPEDVQVKTPLEVWRDVRWLIERLREARPTARALDTKPTDRLAGWTALTGEPGTKPK